MNTLNIIKRRIEKAEATRRAQIHTSYRDIPTSQSWQRRDVHGTFVYRGITYTKWKRYTYTDYVIAASHTTVTFKWVFIHLVSNVTVGSAQRLIGRGSLVTWHL